MCGRIYTDFYEKDGKRIYKTYVVVEEHDFAESKAQSSGQASTYSQPTDADGFMNIPDGIDEELPFM